MDFELFKAVEGSATVLTGSQRLAWSLNEGFSDYQRDRGRSVWKTPRILPWDSWLQQCWHSRALDDAEDALILLNPVQEAAVWQAVVAESPEGRTLLRVAETAEQAMNAWALVQAHRLPFQEGILSTSEDCAAFFRWACDFTSRCRANGWLEKARLSDLVADLIRQGRMERPFPVILAGFDELTPQQTDLLGPLCGATIWHPAAPPGKQFTAGLGDTNEEIHYAARWARQMLEANPSARIGIGVPNIELLRSKLERAFREEVAGAFHISLGPPLEQSTLVHAALLVLEYAAGAMEVNRTGMLVRSAFIKGAGEEGARRAWLDAQLRRGKGEFRELARSCPMLDRMLGIVDREVRKIPGEESPSSWSRSFSRLLTLAGWPGDRVLGSEEHQALDSWNSVLSSFATLDTVTGRIPLSEALRRLRKLAADTRFQPEDEGAPVQIVGLLEASGLRFDRLWILGLHDEALPPAANPNPFLPIGLQRQHALPHCSAERELDFNRKLLSRLVASAPDVVLSYPRWDGDQPLSPSPLLCAEWNPADLPLAKASWKDSIRASSALETLEDAAGPPLPIDSHQHGGTYVLKHMAACPFRAYAMFRLGARELEEPSLGIDARERGSVAHRALAFIWGDLKDQARLRGMSTGELQQLLAAGIGDALGSAPGLGRVLERQRLARVLSEWLEFEKARPPFRVVDREGDDVPVTIGGLEISTRIDRVDELPDGRRIIIDYKTGVTKSGAWLGNRPEEPQVPLYCATRNEPIAAAAFAQLRTGDVLFRGVSDNGELGAMKEMKTGRHVRLSELIDEWSRALHALAEQFRAGHAAVDPKNRSTCDYCDVTALCRIHDAAAFPEDSDD